MAEALAERWQALPSGPPEIKRDAEGRKIYEPYGNTLVRFLADRTPTVQKQVSIIRGPIGSGTSSCSCVRLMAHLGEQAPGPDQRRRSRWAVVRNTYSELKETTIKTWLGWFPEEQYGRFVWSRPFRHEVKIGDVDAEVIFLALDVEEDVKKLRSLELTGVWFNELEFIEKAIFDEALSRCGRYPAMSDGGPTWCGVIADMNAPNEDHWVPMMMGEVALPEEMTEEERREYEKPDTWKYFVQPPGLIEVHGPDGKMVTGHRPNPLAENVKWLPGREGYYVDLIRGKKPSWIKSRVLNKITLHVDGKAVWPSFREDVHVARKPLVIQQGYGLSCGLDFGRSPAAVFAQNVRGRWLILAEFSMSDAGATTFAPALRRFAAQHFPGVALGDITFWGDPKGADKVQSHEATAYDIFAANGMLVRPAPVPGNNIGIRLEAVESALSRMVDGEPAFLLSPACRTLKVGMAGAYHFRRVQGTQRYTDEPEKDRYSHGADALQYVILGGGEGRVMTGRAVGAGAGGRQQIWRGSRGARRRA